MPEAISGDEVDGTSVDWSGADFVWQSETVRMAAFGAAAVVEAQPGRTLQDEVSATFSALSCESPVVVGALPFDRAQPRRLVVPAVVYRRYPDGTTIRTAVDGPSVEYPRSDVPVDVESHDETRYKEMVASALDLLVAEGIRKIVVARRYEYDAGVFLDRAAVVRALADRARRSFVFADGNFVGASPELLVRRSGGHAWSEPMAGTMPLSTGEVSQDLIVERLLTPEKRYEHAPTPAHVAQVLGQVAEVTSHEVEVRAFPTLAHLVTRVEAHNASSMPTAIELAEMLHPTPAVGTSPPSAIATIHRVEGYDRRRYAGPVGWMDASGDGEWAIALRCGEIQGSRALLTAGNGITELSEPHEEWLETESKLEVMIDAIRSTLR